ncbi:MAG: hypothetical protein HYR76_11635 [Ignavibacteria bacterium]|nr:hypothetical protein [Ignavibacteria bacterium]MBI3766440.1 hypothetical protein [Ignavibacteriales bacterium]
MKSFVMFTILLAILFVGCAEKKVEPLPVGVMNEYRDPGYGFKVKYPKDWKQMGTTGNAVFAPSQDVVDKFQNPTTGIEGGMVTAEVLKYEGKTADAIVQAGKDNLKQTWQNVELQPDIPVTVAGKQATGVRYTIPVSSKKKIVGSDLYVPGDTAMYKLTTISFGEDQVIVNANIYDKMIASFEMPVVVAKKSDVWAPSTNIEPFKSPFFTMQVPDNLESVPVNKGNNDFAMEMRADRRDCSIHIDVFGAKGLTVEKVWNQNKGRYKAKNTGTTTIDGNTVYWVDYSPIKDINSRAYFVVKNDKVIRTTINWFAPQKDIYFPVFEYIVKSLKLK